MTRAVTPQPARHNGHTLGFHSATPGTRSSSGTKRMSWCSGFPQPASVAVVPVTAVSLMKSRLSMERDGFSRALVVTGQTVVRGFLFPMTTHAEAHVVIHRPLG